MEEFIQDIPTYEKGEWTTTSFDSREDFKIFIQSIFKEPGKYGFNKDSLIFNEQGRFFNQNDYYCDAPFKSKDFIAYWDFEKNKCRKVNLKKY